MKKYEKFIALILSLILVFTLSACGSSEESASAAASAEASASEEESVVEDSSAEEASSVEDSSVEEEVYEPTVDELFEDLIAEYDGVYVKLQCYNRKGTPIRNGNVVISDGEEERSFETDFSGYALIDGLAFDTEYTVSVDDGDEEEPTPCGSFTLTIVEEEEYAGTEDEETPGSITISVADGQSSAVDMAVTANDDDGSIAVFTLSRSAVWAGVPED